MTLTINQAHEKAQGLRMEALRLEDRLRTARKRLHFATGDTVSYELACVSTTLEEVDEVFAHAVFLNPDRARSQFDWTPEETADWVRRGRRVAAKETKT